jgi:hypothetical protein
MNPIERLPRRRPVRNHPGIYYRPRADGKVGPPYEFTYFDSNGSRRWEVVHGNLEVADTRKAELRLRRRRGERVEPNRQTSRSTPRIGSSVRASGRARSRSTAGR